MVRALLGVAVGFTLTPPLGVAVGFTLTLALTLALALALTLALAPALALAFSLFLVLALPLPLPLTPGALEAFGLPERAGPLALRPTLQARLGPTYP